jgi:hypothetical protein
MGFGIIYVMWASTYFFSWYGLYDNPQDLKKMRGDSLNTNMQEGSVVTLK